MKFRLAHRNDLEKIIEMLSDDPLGAKREDFRLPLPSSYIEAFDHISSDPNQELTVLEIDEKLVGTMQITFIPYLTYQGGIRTQIEAVRIAKEYRSMGLGENMFKYAIERARNRKSHVVQLTTDKKRPEALKFYEKLGFVASHEGMKLHL